jgi:chromosome transmission fidelity protein 4
LAERSKESIQRPVRAGSPDSLDDILGNDEEMRDFVDDDDGAGYAEELNLFGKRPNGYLNELDGPDTKRVYSTSLQPKAHPPLQPGSTPWAGNRRYLCMYY